MTFQGAFKQTFSDVDYVPIRRRQLVERRFSQRIGMKVGMYPKWTYKTAVTEQLLSKPEGQSSNPEVDNV